MKDKYKYILVFAWMIVIFMLSNEPAVVSSGRSDLIVHTISTSFHSDLSQSIMTFLVRKSAHITAYFILGILIVNIIKNLKISTGRVITLSVIFAAAYAMSDEFHQLFVTGRSCELRDVMIDTVAATIGVILCYFITRIRVASTISS